MKKLFELGIEEVCPTDCTIYVKSDKKKKVFLIDSPSWKKLRYDIMASIEALLKEDTSRDEVRKKE